MQLSALFAIVLAGASITVAMPAYEKRQAGNLCSGLTSAPLCCATDVLGLADLDCASPQTLPTDIENFTDICASVGQRARCCAIPILGQALVCVTPA